MCAINVKNLVPQDHWKRRIQQEIFQAVACAVKDVIIDRWLANPAGI